MTKRCDGELRQRTLPPQPPDLSLFKMVWGDMDHRVKAKETTGAQQLQEEFRKNHVRRPHEAQKNEQAKQNSKQMVAGLKNLKPKTRVIPHFLFDT